METNNFIEIATYCTNRYRESHSSSSSSYAGTLYVAVLEDNQVLCSRTPHILSNCIKCILVHTRDTVALSNSYYWYDVEIIDECKCVSNENLGGGFTLRVTNWGTFSNQIMSLDFNGSHLFWCRPPFEDHMNKIWELYSKVKDLSSPSEIQLISELFRKDDQILAMEREMEDFKFTNHLLEEERNQYKELLDEVKRLVNNNS